MTPDEASRLLTGTTPGDAYGWHYKPIKTRQATEQTP